MNKILDTLRSYFTKKGAGFYVTVATLVLVLMATISYACIDKSIYNVAVVIIGSICVILSIIFAIFDVTYVLAPTTLMVAALLMICGVALADGFIDYISTVFFDGVTLETIASLPASLTITVICSVIAFISGSVAMYLSFNKKNKKQDKENA